MAISRTGFGSKGLSASALTRSQLALPKVGSCNQGFHGPSKVPSSRMATNPLNLLAMPSRMSSYRGRCSGVRSAGGISVQRMATPQFLDGSEPTPRPGCESLSRRAQGRRPSLSALDARHRGIVERIEEYLRRYAGGGNLELVEA